MWDTKVGILEDCNKKNNDARGEIKQEVKIRPVYTIHK